MTIHTDMKIKLSTNNINKRNYAKLGLHLQTSKIKTGRL